MAQQSIPARTKKGRIPGVALLTLGTAFLAYFGIWCAGYLRWSFDVGVIFILASGLMMAVTGALLLACGELPVVSRHKRLKKILSMLLGLFLLSFAVIEGFVVFQAQRDDSFIKADFILIPGAAIVDDQPSLVLKHRLDKALSYIRSNENSIIIVSGAKGADERYTEAEVMKNYLVQNSVPAGRIIMEERAVNSVQNVAYCKEIVEQYSLDHKPKVMVVTSDFHMFRMMLLAKSQGLTVLGVSAKLHYSVAPIAYCREYFSVMKLLINGMQAE